MIYNVNDNGNDTYWVLHVLLLVIALWSLWIIILYNYFITFNVIVYSNIVDSYSLYTYLYYRLHADQELQAHQRQAAPSTERRSWAHEARVTRSAEGSPRAICHDVATATTFLRDHLMGWCWGLGCVTLYLKVGRTVLPQNYSRE